MVLGARESCGGCLRMARLESCAANASIARAPLLTGGAAPMPPHDRPPDAATAACMPATRCRRWTRRAGAICRLSGCRHPISPLSWVWGVSWASWAMGISGRRE